MRSSLSAVILLLEFDCQIWSWVTCHRIDFIVSSFFRIFSLPHSHDLVRSSSLGTPEYYSHPFTGSSSLQYHKGALSFLFLGHSIHPFPALLVKYFSIIQRKKSLLSAGSIDGADDQWTWGVIIIIQHNDQVSHCSHKYNNKCNEFKFSTYLKCFLLSNLGVPFTCFVPECKGEKREEQKQR